MDELIADLVFKDNFTSSTGYITKITSTCSPEEMGRYNCSLTCVIPYHLRGSGGSGVRRSSEGFEVLVVGYGGVGEDSDTTMSDGSPLVEFMDKRTKLSNESVEMYATGTIPLTFYSVVAVVGDVQTLLDSILSSVK